MKSILVLHFFFSVIHSSVQVATTSLFTYRGLLPETPDTCVFEVHSLSFQSKRMCAVFCAENLLCNAFYTCFSKDVNVCRLRYGKAKVTAGNHSLHCDYFEMITNTNCEDGFFLRSRGICKNNNLALHSPTTMSSVLSNPLWPFGNGSYAVNGEVRSDDSECAHTQEDNFPFLTIDLLDNFFVGRVVFTNRGSSEWRLHDVNVSVGGDGSNFDCFCGFFKGPGTPYQRVDIVCQEHCRGRFVRLQIVAGPEFLQLCEVEVYSNCNL